MEKLPNCSEYDSFLLYQVEKVVEIYVKENTTELVAPLDVQKKMLELQEKRMAFLAEFDTQIKVSNATTFIEID